MPATLHIHVLLYYCCSLHIDPTLLHISVNTTKCNFKFAKLQPYYVPQIQSMGYIPELLDVPQWGRNANIYTKYKLAVISDAAKNPVHRLLMIMLGDNTR